MKVRDEEIKDFIREYYGQHHREFCLTTRICDRLLPILKDGLEKATNEVSMEKARPAIERFLEKDSILQFISDRQPYMEPVPEQVISDLKRYFENFMPEYSICHVCRKLNHREDKELYCLTARKRDGSYSCWTLWNEATKSLNRGHYELLGEEEGANILRSYFNDITDEPENYGMEKTKVVVKASVDESISATVSDNIILLNGHRGR